MMKKSDDDNDDSDDLAGDGTNVTWSEEAGLAYQEIQNVFNRHLHPWRKSWDTYLQMTNQFPWVPLSNDEDDESKVEERNIFDELKEQLQYNINARPSSRQGYQNFELEWNRLAFDRYKRHMRGEDVVLIYFKSMQQLQEWGRRCLKVEAQAPLLRQDLTRAKIFPVVWRSTWRSLEVPTVAQPEPQSFRAAGGYVQPGDPFVVNSHIAMGMVHPRSSSENPYDMSVAVAMKQKTDAPGKTMLVNPDFWLLAANLGSLFC
jgi:hypothetical protein